MRSLARAWAHLRGRRFGDWMWCSSGQHFWPLDPRPDEVHVHDIARGISNECRYAGQISDAAPGQFYSVAEHAYMVGGWAEYIAECRGFTPSEVLDAARWGHHHDDTEAYIGDIIRPLKYESALRGFRRAEVDVEKVVKDALQLRPNKRVRELVDEVDSRILVDEIEVLIAFPDMNRVRAQFGERLGATIHCYSPEEAERRWLKRHTQLEFRRAQLAYRMAG